MCRTLHSVTGNVKYDVFIPFCSGFSFTKAIYIYMCTRCSGFSFTKAIYIYMCTRCSGFSFTKVIYIYMCTRCSGFSFTTAIYIYMCTRWCGLSVLQTANVLLVYLSDESSILKHMNVHTRVNTYTL